MTPRAEISSSLGKDFISRHVTAALGHFEKAVEEFQKQEWEKALAKAGKFIEATVKALGNRAGLTVPTGRDFQAGKIITGLENLQRDKADDCIRVTLPRACRFVYDIVSNRGGRHDPGEIDPNEMDANVVISVCSWILAEMFRYSQKGKVSTARARELVEGLTSKRYPILEDVDGRVYFHAKNKSAREVGLVLLLERDPKRMSRDDLASGITRHGFKPDNVRKAVERLKNVVDDDGNGNLKLLIPGKREAERLIEAAMNGRS